jgi:ubiquinone/menaquinone biosynthesis C-methylase UbiE
METGRFDTARGDRLNNPERLKELRPVQVIKEVADVKPSMTCVDFGSGTGVFTFPMSEAVGAAGLVYAVDNSANMLELVKSKGLPANIRLIQADAAATGLQDECADLCLCVLILHEVDSPERVILEARRVLKPGGKIIIMEWKMDSDWGPPRSIRLSREKIELILKEAGIGFERFIDWSSTCYIVTGKKSISTI